MIIREICVDIPREGALVARRQIAPGTLHNFFLGIRMAYDSAGLIPDDGQETPSRMRPGIEDESGTFQVGLRESNAYGISVARFVAVTAEGEYSAAAELMARDGQFYGSQGRATSPDVRRRPFEFQLSRGPNGTLARVVDFIFEHAEDEQFRPVEADTTLLSLV